MHVQITDPSHPQPLHLGLFRSDYLLHDESVDPAKAEQPAATDSQHRLAIKQVEFNTISSSFGPLCSLVSRLHQHLWKTTRQYYGELPSEEAGPSRLPPNKALQTLAGGIAAAHRAYLQQQQSSRKDKEEPSVLFVVQPNERNAFDQRAIEYELLHEHGIRSVRRTFGQLAGISQAGSAQTSERDAATLKLPTNELFVPAPWSASAADTSISPDSTHAEAHLEISVVYFRAGYGPGDYEGPGNEHSWEVRLLLERSRAVKCPSVALQLAGAKKVQQVLAEPGVLERFLLSEKRPAAESGTREWTREDLAAVRASWTELYSMDAQSQAGKEALDLALREPHRFVLKPQREGGGNNIYKADIPPALNEMEQRDKSSAKGSIAEREGYILMSLIQPPTGVGNWLVKAGAGTGQGAALAPDVVSELGIYGTCLFGEKSEGGATEILANESGGHLLRTKGRDSNEGGVAVGFSVIDSPYLV